MKKVQVYDKRMVFLTLDMAPKEIPDSSLVGANQYIQDLFAFFEFVHKMFLSNKIPSHLYTMQKEQPHPGGESVKYRNTHGYMLMGAFAEDEFMKHFRTLCRAAIAINCGYVGMNVVMNTEIKLDHVAGLILSLDAKEGTYGLLKGGQKKATQKVGSFTSLAELDWCIENYHNFFILNSDGSRRSCVTENASETDTEEMAMERARLLSFEYLLKNSRRMDETKKLLLSLGQIVIRNESSDNISFATDLETVAHYLNEMTEDNVIKDVFLQHYNWLQYESNVTTMRNEEDDREWMEFDSTNRIMWDMTHHTKIYDFHMYKFFVIHTSKKILNRVSHGKDNVDVSNMDFTDEESLILQQDATRDILAKECNGSEEALYEAAGTLFPALYHLGNDDVGVFACLAESVGMSKHICGMYQDPVYRTFMTDKYNTAMEPYSTMEMSAPRQFQNMTIHTLMKDTFPSGCMNSLLDVEGNRMLLVCCKDDEKEVDPLQGALANHFLRSAKVAGVKQVSVEFMLMLMANVLSFCPIDHKPIIVLDGPPACGKSNATNMVKIVLTSDNKLACISEDYITSRSRTVPDPDRKYQAVLGSKIINEWICDSSANYKDDTSLESTILKNTYDFGKCTSQRAAKKTSKTGVERFVQVHDVCFDNQVPYICANGFHTCWSIADRCVISSIPALRAKVVIAPLEVFKRKLDNAAIPKHHTLIRYLVSEQMNRDYVNMALKSWDGEDMINSSESKLTIERINDVLCDLGFHKDVMSVRKKEQINYFALVLAGYRAAFEVYGCMWNTSEPEQPEVGQSVTDYNNDMVEKMIQHLANKSKDEKDMMMAERMVVDPVDIIAAATLILPFTKSEESLQKVLAIHMASPDQTEERDNKTYLVVDNLTLVRIAQEMDSQGHAILENTLTLRLMKIEDQSSMKNVRTFIRDATADKGINSNREKKFHHFKLCILASFAAELFLTEEKKLVEDCIECIANHFVKVMTGQEPWKVYPFTDRSQSSRMCHDTISVPIPQRLRHAFTFLAHLPGKLVWRPAMVGFMTSPTTEKEVLCVGIHPSFANCTTRALQKIVVGKFTDAWSGVNQLPLPSFSYKERFLAVDITGRNYFCQKVTGLPQCEDMDKMLVTKSNGHDENSHLLRVHVDVFAGKFDDLDGIDILRNMIVERYLATGQLAEENYFQLEDTKQTISLNKSIMQAKVMGNREICFTDDSLYVSPSILSKVTSTSCERKSLTRAFVEKCLCKDMTMFKSVMFFNKEKVYETQKEMDAIGFVSVKDVATRLYGGNLPVFKTNLPNNTDENIELYTQVLSDITTNQDENGKDTYRHDHHNTRLALKHLYATNSINLLIKKTNTGKKSKDEKRVEFTTKLNKMINVTKKTYLKNLIHPLIQKKEGQATNVYHKNHPFIKLCCLSTKRPHDDDDANLSFSSKRQCQDGI
jgi:hypothetical protein